MVHIHNTESTLLHFFRLGLVCPFWPYFVSIDILPLEALCGLFWRFLAFCGLLRLFAAFSGFLRPCESWSTFFIWPFFTLTLYSKIDLFNLRIFVLVYCMALSYDFARPSYKPLSSFLDCLTMFVPNYWRKYIIRKCKDSTTSRIIIYLKLS